MTTRKKQPVNWRIITIVLTIALIAGIVWDKQPKTNNDVTLSMVPNAMSALKGQKNTVSIAIETKSNTVSAVELTLSFDPKVLRVDNAVPGDFFVEPTILLKKIDNTSGKLIYVLGSLKPKKGAGSLASITVTKIAASGTTTLMLTEDTKVAAIGAGSTNVLNSAKGIKITITEP